MRMLALCRETDSRAGLFANPVRSRVARLRCLIWAGCNFLDDAVPTRANAVASAAPAALAADHTRDNIPCRAWLVPCLFPQVLH